MMCILVTGVLGRFLVFSLGSGVYQPFDDRPGFCEGCLLKDRPGEDGPSALQLVWNALTGEWLCTACRHGYSEWVTRVFPDEKSRWESRPTYMRRFCQVHPFCD